MADQHQLTTGSGGATAGDAPGPEQEGGRSASPLGVERLRYVPPLDGIRALAVLGVMAFHGGVSWARGGFLGVDAFFVLSGFLITTLLVDEWRASGSIGLGGFWSRRARRLLPALFLLLGAIALYCVFLAAPDVLDSLRLDALYTLGYAANWHQVVAGQSYFAQQALPSPLLHTWSLAIEEQFYIVWPLVVLGILTLRGRRLVHAERVGRRGRRALRPLLKVAVAGAVASAVEMALLYHPGSDPTRVYYGTDTRAQSILIGAALAVLLAVRTPVVRSAKGRAGLVGAAVAGAAFVGWMWVDVTGSTAWLYRGGFAAGAVCVAAVIACVALLPASVPARVLSFSPLRFVGRISYGLYLWHWPIYIVLDGSRTGLEGAELLWARVAASFAAAVLSYYLVERPVRRGLFRNWRAWLATPIAVGAASTVVVFATVQVAPVGEFASSVASLAPGSSAPASVSGPGPAAAQPSGSDRPVRMLLVGDSVGLTLGMGLSVAAPRYGVDVWNKSIIGCGLATGGPTVATGSVQMPLPVCSTWPSQYAADVAQFNPDVAAVMVGPWETLDRVHDGRWGHLGEPWFDAFEAQEIDTAVQVLSSRGARVVLFTSPYYDHGEQPNGQAWPQDNPARVDALNKLMYQAAARHPGLVSVVPLGSYLSPGGHFATDVGGVTARWSDGIHITVPGGVYLAHFVLPQVVRIGHTRPGFASVPPLAHDPANGDAVTPAPASSSSG